MGVALCPLVALALSSRAATAPRVDNPHGAFREDCGQCHRASGWKPVRIGPKFDHSRYGFALTGAHAAAGCRSCHTSLEFKRERAQCASCHADPHQGELGIDCARCHSARSFLDRGPLQRMHQLTAFPLTGSHAGLDCESCHRPRAAGQLRYVGTRSDCVSCHRGDYDRAADPPHAAAGFPTDCARCHSALTWGRARFDHAGTDFPLTGAHRTVACASCHPGGRYTGTPTACVSCHQSDYDATTDPPHAGSGFATDCASCHSTTAWDGATFDHDGRFFPIHSGTHQGKWSACSDCHDQPANYAAFTCLTCHPHDDRAATDGHHSSVGGYAYDSRACYNCHPTGRH